jgi:hypothetical protein
MAVMAVKWSKLFRHLLDITPKQRAGCNKIKNQPLEVYTHVQLVRGWAIMQEQSTTPNAEANAFVNETHTRC